MKKYKTPTMKVRTISPVRMLCTSTTSIGDVTKGNRYNTPDYYIEGSNSKGNFYESDLPD